MIVYAPCPRGNEWDEYAINKWFMEWNYQCISRTYDTTPMSADNSRYVSNDTTHEAKPLLLTRALR